MTTTYLLDDISTFITASALPYNSGTNLYAGLMVDSPDDALAIFEYSGLEPMYVMGEANSLPAISQPHLQIVARDVSYVTARADAEEVTRLLETIVNMTVNGTFYQRVARLQDPFFMQRDAVQNRVYFCCNFDVMRSPS